MTCGHVDSDMKKTILTSISLFVAACGIMRWEGQPPSNHYERTSLQVASDLRGGFAVLRISPNLRGVLPRCALRSYCWR